MSLIWIEHEGQEILLIDVANLRDDHGALSLNLISLVKMLKGKPLKSVLAVADLRNTHLSNRAVMALLKKCAFGRPLFS